MAKPKPILLPQTEEEFNKLTDLLVKKFKLPNREHAAVLLANRIAHLPPDQAYATVDYLGHCIQKNIAFQVAQAMGSKINHKLQIDAIDTALVADPHNQQALDALQKAANEGSEYAREVLKKYIDSSPRVLPLRAVEACEPVEAS